jgi:hypothetical protein
MWGGRKLSFSASSDGYYILALTQARQNFSASVLSAVIARGRGRPYYPHLGRVDQGRPRRVRRAQLFSNHEV